LANTILEAIVVGDRRHDRRVGGQGNRRQFVPFQLETANQFGGQVLRVGSRAAVAAGEDLAVVEQAGDHCLDRLGNRSGEQFDGVELGLRAVLEVLADASDQIHGFDSAERRVAGDLNTRASTRTRRGARDGSAGNARLEFFAGIDRLGTAGARH
jgi:hypothetical protein